MVASGWTSRKVILMQTAIWSKQLWKTYNNATEAVLFRLLRIKLSCAIILIQLVGKSDCGFLDHTCPAHHNIMFRAMHLVNENVFSCNSYSTPFPKNNCNMSLFFSLDLGWQPHVMVKIGNVHVDKLSPEEPIILIIAWGWWIWLWGPRTKRFLKGLLKKSVLGTSKVLGERMCCSFIFNCP